MPVCESHVELPEGAGNATALNLRFKILDLTAFAGDTHAERGCEAAFFLRAAALIAAVTALDRGVLTPRARRTRCDGLTAIRRVIDATDPRRSNALFRAALSFAHNCQQFLSASPRER